MLEIPDARLLAGDLLFLLKINFLLQIANEVSDSDFWLNGGFGQPVMMPTSLLAVIVRDSKMSISWVLAAIWSRSYSSSSVSDDKTAIKVALQVWVDYCSLRILLELGESFLFTHSSISMGMIAREVWYTAIVMSFFRWGGGIQQIQMNGLGSKQLTGIILCKYSCHMQLSKVKGNLALSGRSKNRFSQNQITTLCF